MGKYIRISPEEKYTSLGGIHFLRRQTGGRGVSKKSMFFYKGEGRGFKENVYIDFDTIIIIQFANNFSKKVSQKI